MHAAVELQDVTVRFDRKKGEPLVALDHLDLRIEPGEVLGLLGPNGSGKTTTVNAICGLLEPTEGTVVVGGHNVADNVAAVRAMTGVVPQETALYNDLTAEENLLFHARLYGVAPED